MKRVGIGRKVLCSGREDITLEHCRFCVHSRAFSIGGRLIPSPARIYCLRHTPSEEKIDFSRVESVECDDLKGEGFRSIMNIIS
ncbi:MAG: hypothetical protein QHG99_03555 [Methanomicrobiales archaeon]|nr:hypothetical protein [Methanomicrobiales archaeon]